MLYRSDGSGCPDSPISLEAGRIRKRYKSIKMEMNTGIVDYLVQSYILTTDENSYLLDRTRAQKCDFILRRLIRNSNCLTKLVTLMHKEPNDLDEFDCFRFLLRDTSPEPEIPNNNKQGTSSSSSSSLSSSSSSFKTYTESAISKKIISVYYQNK